MGNLDDTVLDWIASQRLFEGVNGILLAVSGGADSVALAYVLHRLVEASRIEARLVIGHVNHGLRGAASDGDEAFVAGLGDALGVRVVHRRVDVKGYAATRHVSLETAGRVLRIRALAALAGANGCDAVATGHHADDQAETLVHRLMRGTGLRGLCGIRPENRLEGVRFVRPLLGIRRAEIAAFCRANGLPWREDASNRSCAFTRNRIRHRLLPALDRYLPGAAERLVRLSQDCLAAQVRIEAAATAVVPICRQRDAIAFDRASYTHLSPWVQAELLSRAVTAVGGGLRDVTCRHYQAFMAAAATEGSVTTTWPGALTAAIEQDRVCIARSAAIVSPLPNDPVTLEIGGAVLFGPYRVSADLLDRSTALTEGALRDKPALTERLDADRIQGPLTLRRPVPGDRFWPMGLGHDKKAARFLIDARLDPSARRQVFVLADARHILWLAPLRIDERVKVRSHTRRILELRIEPTAPPNGDIFESHDRHV